MPTKNPAQTPTQKELSEKELDAALKQLQELMPDEELNQLQPSGVATVYTSLVTIWMLVLQRLGGGKSLNAVVKDVLAGDTSFLPDNKRLREGTLSENSGAYSEARSRLQLETVEFFANRVSNSLMEASPPWLGERRAFLIDGTTITLAPTDELREAFPPAANQPGETVWPVAMLLVAHELQSGVALAPEVGAMYGEHNTSEAALAQNLFPRLPDDSIVMADAGFGVFGVAYHATAAGHQILLRMTKTRFASLRRKATLIEQTATTASYRLTWTPTAKNRQTHPDLPADAAIEVTLHEISLDGETLFVVTTLPLSADEAAACYARRYDVEHDIRDIKVTLDTENIRAKSVAMFHKELLTSMVAYNLVIQFRRQAAALANVPPRRLSFTGVWNTFASFLLRFPPLEAADWPSRYEEALRIASRCKLPNRPGRSYTRCAHPRRPKSTKFMKQQAKQKTNSDPTPPSPKPK